MFVIDHTDHLVAFYDGSQGQSQARAAVVGAGGGIRLHKGFEYLLLLFLVHADSGILDGDFHPSRPILTLPGQHPELAIVGELAGVVEEVEQQLPDLRAVAAHLLLGQVDVDDSVLTIEDIAATLRYLIRLHAGDDTMPAPTGELPLETDDIDHFGNRRIRSVGELIQNQVRIGLSRMERVVRERMTTQDVEAITPQTLINIRPVVAAIKEFVQKGGTLITLNGAYELARELFELLRQPIEQRVGDLVSRMTLEEKIGMAINSDDSATG